VRDVDLDLRKEFDLERSRLLHRLRLLEVSWGSPTENRRGKGTFWESWRLAWQPEFAVELVEASGYGTTVAGAAATKVAERAAGSGGEDAAAHDRWLESLDRLARRDDLHGLLAGRLSRLLLDAGRLAPEEAHRRLGLVLTVGVPPARGAAWIEGFLAGGGLL